MQIYQQIMSNPDNSVMDSDNYITSSFTLTVTEVISNYSHTICCTEKKQATGSTVTVPM